MGPSEMAPADLEHDQIFHETGPSGLPRTVPPRVSRAWKDTTPRSPKSCPPPDCLFSKATPAARPFSGVRLAAPGRWQLQTCHGGFGQRPPTVTAPAARLVEAAKITRNCMLQQLRGEDERRIV